MLACASLSLAGALLAGCGNAATPAVDGAPTDLGTAASSAAPSPASASAPSAVRAAPESIRIPTIEVSAPVGALGFDHAEQTVEVPTEPAHAGWYRFGPVPGNDGSAVILGHVDSKTGPAVFARLKELRRGDQVSVTMSDSSVVSYRVDEVTTYPNAKFPARRVYGAKGPSTLNLVTCGGEYDPTAGGYQSNVVVYTSLVTRAP